MTYKTVAWILTALTALAGVLVGVGVVPWVVVAVVGVIAGLWWAFGAKIMPPTSTTADR